MTPPELSLLDTTGDTVAVSLDDPGGRSHILVHNKGGGKFEGCDVSNMIELDLPAATALRDWLNTVLEALHSTA